MLPPSDGTIEIKGVDISEYNDPTLLSICLQFNSHLCQELTPAEHFYLYSKLFELIDEEAEKRKERLIKVLELSDVLDKPIRDLSDGEVRKLSIALSFFGPAEIILLDEPTASLDPNARHQVHEMFAELKGEKTFMLCRHLLSEAESLCDNISIMVKGCVYTCGSPQYLSSKFGTEFKIDVGLIDDGDETQNQSTDFFQNELPQAELSMLRPQARIYSILAA
jgi:ABC-type multidrug transport system ATPase subunit